MITIKDILSKLKDNNYSSSKIELVKKAFAFAEKAHKEQKRVSGEPFITHPLEVANILADFKLDVVTIAAGFLHDTVEDKKTDLESIKKEFGDEVASIVDGLTNLNKFDFETIEEYHAESLRKVIMATAKDIRVIFVRLADKLHNMRTLSCFRPEKQKRIATDSLEIYAPIAYKLGMGNIKWELEDLAFRYLEPSIYNELLEKVKKTREHRENEIAKIKEAIEEELKKNKIKAEVTGRPKHIYSIYRKMLRKNCGFEEIYDVAGVRITTKTVKECYEALGIIHSRWTPLPKEFDDYIAVPKANMYQSLHTVVIGSGGQPVEIQIRTETMNKVAEEGIAAHWKYKGVEGDKKFDDKLSWLKQIMEWQQESKDSKEFMEMLHIDFFDDEIFTFTPKGKVIELPKGSCIIDFAYGVHSQLGEQCTGARVNGKFVPLRALLKNGDVVEIITSKTQGPSRDWLRIVRTPKAQTKIKQYIKGHEGIPAVTIKRGEAVKKELEEWIIKLEKVENPKIKVSKCCNPLPGDPIVGLAAKSGKVSIHKTDCFNIQKLKGSAGKSKIKASWIDSIGTQVEIIVNAKNRVGLFAEILNSLVASQTVIKKANAKSTMGEDVECSFAIEPKSLGHIQEIIRRIKKLEGVRKVYISPLD